MNKIAVDPFGEYQSTTRSREFGTKTLGYRLLERAEPTLSTACHQIRRKESGFFSAASKSFSSSHRFDPSTVYPIIKTSLPNDKATCSLPEPPELATIEPEGQERTNRVFEDSLPNHPNLNVAKIELDVAMVQAIGGGLRGHAPTLTQHRTDCQRIRD